ncbi:formate--tetrahydrofolate ligase [candidate division FCPU426 bacterium]|nr:formate--tetrahydrofolate ligase [candidate division FCPU426 bacterium]
MKTVTPKTFPSDLDIAQKAHLQPITTIAESLGVPDEALELYGRYKAKVRLDIMSRIAERPLGKYIDVTAITPTPLGEGKTVTTIGVSQALAKIGKRVITCIRQPSLGPVFGIKGGAAGGGYSQVVPMEDFNLHLTGDIHAVSMANNLLAAYIDSHLLHGNTLNIDPFAITWRRVVDISDRALRHIVVGLGGRENGYPRETGFDIAVASEVMAILALAKDLQDMRQRLGRIVIGMDRSGKPVTAEDLKCAGAMAVLMKDAIMPTLLQTLEHTPVFVHAGPFANIAHGNSSIIADEMALRLGEYVVTESGFGADCGCEKFMNIKCRYSGLKPDAVVMVCTVRALKMHGGAFVVKPGKALDKAVVSAPNEEALLKGCENLEQHIHAVKEHGVPVVVAINRFATDTDREIEIIRVQALRCGAAAAVPSEVHARGGEGGKALAEAVVAAAAAGNDFRFLYALEDAIKTKIETIATKIYGAAGVEYLSAAEKKIALYTELGYGNLPICMAKTHLSLSHDPALKGRPRDFRVPVRDIHASVGAGFLYPLLGDMRTMPGLPSSPAGNNIDLTPDGLITGLF